MHAGTGRVRSRTSDEKGDSPVTDCDSGRKEETGATMLQLMQEINTISLDQFQTDVLSTRLFQVFKKLNSHFCESDLKAVYWP